MAERVGLPPFVRKRRSNKVFVTAPGVLCVPILWPFTSSDVRRPSTVLSQGNISHERHEETLLHMRIEFHLGHDCWVAMQPPLNFRALFRRPVESGRFDVFETYAVKWSLDQPGEIDGEVLSLGLSSDEAQAALLGSEHFRVDADEVEVKFDQDRDGNSCYYVFEKEANDNSLSM